jgi:hypothetical protein
MPRSLSRSWCWAAGLWCFWGAVASAGAVRWAGGCRPGLVAFGRWSSVPAGRLLCSFVDVRVVPGRGWFVGVRLGEYPGVGWWRGLQVPEVDGRGSLVAGAGGLAGFLDGVAVVPGAFDRAGATAVPALRVGSVRDVGQHGGQGGVPVLRGERPPFRWRYGGPVAAFG